MTPHGREILQKIASLLELEQNTGVNTRRTRKHLLMTLGEDDLIETGRRLHPRPAIDALTGLKVGAR